MKELIIFRGLNSLERHNAALNMLDYKQRFGINTKYINRREHRGEVIMKYAKPEDLDRLCETDYTLEQAIEGSYRLKMWNDICKEIFWKELILTLQAKDYDTIIIEGGFILMEDIRMLEKIHKWGDASILIAEVTTNSVPQHIKEKTLRMLMQKIDSYRMKLYSICDEYMLI